MGGYYIINGYRKNILMKDGCERVEIELLRNGRFFTATLLEKGISEERVKKVEEYLKSIFDNLDGLGTGEAALITILYYIQSV